MLTIGELASRTGVATSALRYWEELGLLPAPARVSGQRRYPPSAVGQVGLVIVLRGVGFTLREVKAFITARSPAGDGWRELYRRKLTELDQRIAQAQVARTAIVHGLACPHEDISECPTFARGIAALLAGSPLEEAHERAHSPDHAVETDGPPTGDAYITDEAVRPERPTIMVHPSLRPSEPGC
ncbi:MerR family transcriptional regulator [Nonomuraea deserti]|uniref:MerR family transcriptional regulator n=1 Tax=Nonomuraea deserti TaxID=1848322 RepID=UPI0014042B7E|nr:MerR family transcriptional regulator [Nonomuraea deserti]